MPKIYAESKQNKPLRVYGQAAAITIFRTSDVLRHAIDRSMSSFAISQEQYNVLRILRGAGDAGLPTLEISGRMLSRSPNITRLLDRLIARKLVWRVRSRQDRRVVVISITAQGLELLGHLDVVVEDLFKRFPSTTKAEMQVLLDVLDRIREHMAIRTATELSLERPRSDSA